MKKFYLLVFIALCAASLSVFSGGRYILLDEPGTNGDTYGGYYSNQYFRVDTIDSYQAGPGATYVKVRLTCVECANATVLNAYVLQVDRRNPYVSFEEVLGNQKLVGRERPSAMASRISTGTHVAFAGTNGDFYETSGNIGCPIGLTIENNEYAFTGSTDRRVGVIKPDRTVYAAQKWEFSGQVYVVGKTDTLTLNRVNLKRDANELVLFNYLNGASTNTDNSGTELLVELASGHSWTTDGVQEVIVKSKVSDGGNTSLSKGQAVLSGAGTMKTALDNINVGDRLGIKFALKLDGVNSAVSQAVSGDNRALIVKDGVVPTSGYMGGIAPRTGFGTSKSGDTVIFCVTDGRLVEPNVYGNSSRVLGTIMKYFGAYRAINWDGGGSCCLYIRNQGQLNKSSDGSERAVGNAMFAIANLPSEDNSIATISTSKSVVRLAVGDTYTPQFKGYNTYGLLINKNLSGVSLSCDPLTGTVSGSTFTCTGDGDLTATYGDISTTIRIETLRPELALPAQPTFANPTSIPRSGANLSCTIYNSGSEFKGDIAADIYLGSTYVATWQTLTGVTIANGSFLKPSFSATFPASLHANASYHIRLKAKEATASDFTLLGSTEYNKTTTFRFSGYNTTINDWACEGYKYEKNGFSIDVADLPAVGVTKQFTRTVTINSLRDSVILLNLTTRVLPVKNISDAFCDDSSYTIYGHSYTTATETTFVVPATTGCDTIVNLSLINLTSRDTSVYGVMCKGGTYTYLGKTFTSAGVHRIPIPYKNYSCDSVVYNLHLSYLTSRDTNVYVTIFDGETCTYMGQTFDKEKIYVIPVKYKSYDCDSIYHRLHLRVRLSADQITNMPCVD